MEKIIEILQRIGFSNKESKVYLTLNNYPESKTGFLCKETKIPSSHIYNILGSLIEKGLVLYKIKNNIKIYSASSPEILNQFYLEKQKKLSQEKKLLKNLIKKLEKNEIKEKSFSNYKYFEGVYGVMSLWEEINSLMETNDEIKCYTAKKQSLKKLIPFYAEHHKLRNDKNIKEKLILSNEDKGRGEKIKNNLTQIKYSNLENHAEWGIFRDYFYIQYVNEKEPRAFFIKDKIFADTFGEIYNKLWEKLN